LAVLRLEVFSMSEPQKTLVAVLRRILEPVVEREGCDLVALEILGSPGRALLRVYIDRIGGVNVDVCAKVSRAISPALDVEDPFPGTYDLEVSSPGIERPLQRENDFRRFVGFGVKVKLAPGPERRRYSGTLRGLEDGHVLVEVQADCQTHRLPFDQIEKAHLDLDDEQFAQLEATNNPLASIGASHDQ
jgi:ribosome maturation factor RimP